MTRGIYWVSSLRKTFRSFSSAVTGIVCRLSADFMLLICQSDQGISLNLVLDYCLMHARYVEGQ
jgi:hypothetical protein